MVSESGSTLEFCWILDNILCHRGIQMREHRLYPALTRKRVLRLSEGTIAARCQLAWAR